jgi:phospholipid/cholesterol/gamma-HCH transport system substrate-binding protein
VTNQAKVGIFTTVTVAIFILGFYYLKGTDLFVRKNVYYAVYERVDGLYKSNLVEINGYNIGRVGNMDRNPETGKIVVELDLDKNIKVPKSDSTVALLVSTDFLGSKKVKLVFGHSTVFMNDGDTINTLFKKDITEQIGSQIDPIMLGVQTMLPKLDSTVGGIKIMFDPDDKRSVFTTFNKVNAILDQNQQNLALTIANLKTITANFETYNESITKILANTNNFTDSLQKANIKQTVDNLNTTILQLKTMVTNLNEGKGTLGKVMKDDELYTKVDSAIGNLNILLKDFKARPYRYIDINVLGNKKATQRRIQRDNESGK